MSDEVYKAQATRLAEHLAVTYGFKLKHQAALNAIAAVHGVKNWHVLASADSPVSASPVHGALLSAWLAHRASAVPEACELLQALAQSRHDHYAAIAGTGSVKSPESVRDLSGPLYLDDKGLPQVLCVQSTRGSNFVLGGVAGSGKTMLLFDIVADALARQQVVTVLDYGYSYKRFCDALGGQFVELDIARPIGLNPFSLMKTEKDFLLALPLMREWLLSVLSQDYQGHSAFATTVDAAVRSNWRHFQESAAFEAEVNTAMLTVWKAQQAQGKVGTLQDVAELLSRSITPEMTVAAHQLLDRLSGPLATWASRSCEVEFKKGLTVLEVENLAQAQNLIRSCVPQLAAIAATLGASHGAMEVGKLLVIEEPFYVFHRAHAFRYVTKLQKQWASLGGGVGLVVQDRFSEDDEQGWRALLSNASTHIWLQQRQESWAQLSRYYQTPATEALVKSWARADSLRGIQFVVVRDNAVAAKFTARLDPLTLAAFDLRPKVAFARNALIASGKNLVEGLRLISTTI